MISNLLFRYKQRLFPSLITSNQLTRYLKNSGINVGKGTLFYDAGSITVDISRPCLLEIGEYCKITGGVTILTHDYSRSVLRRTNGIVIGEGRKTTIGNNVFIGMKSIILMGTQIGSNVIIGAGSIVSGAIPDSCVVAGNPARVICSLDDFYEKRIIQSEEEAFNYVTIFKEKYGRIPNIEEMNPFYWLFMERNIENVKKHNISMALGGDNEFEIMDAFLNTKPKYDGYESFINAWRKRN